MVNITVAQPADREVAAADATSGMVREQAFGDGYVWAGVVRTAPGRASGWHHHGDHETYFYVDSGTVRMEFGPGGRTHVEATHGDFVHVPGGLIRREVTTAPEPGAIVLFRVGGGPPVVNVEGPEED